MESESLGGVQGKRLGDSEEDWRAFRPSLYHRQPYFVFVDGGLRPWNLGLRWANSSSIMRRS